GSTSLDLTSAETDNNVGNGDIFSLTRPVGDHDAPASSIGVLCGLDRLAEGTNLVDLEEERVASLLLDSSLDADGVGDSQVITNNLEVGVLVEVSPGFPVVFGKGVFDGDDVVLLGELLVEVGQFLVGEPLVRVRVG